MVPSSKPTSSSSAGGTPSAGLPTLLPLSTPIAHSSDVWTSDLRTLFESAKDRFGDVSWEVGGQDEDDDDELESDAESTGEAHSDRIWGHKGQSGIRLHPSRT